MVMVMVMFYSLFYYYNLISGVGHHADHADHKDHANEGEKLNVLGLV
jgi:hypothetical protein